MSKTFPGYRRRLRGFNIEEIPCSPPKQAGDEARREHEKGFDENELFVAQIIDPYLNDKACGLDKEGQPLDLVELMAA